MDVRARSHATSLSFIINKTHQYLVIAVTSSPFTTFFASSIILSAKVLIT